MAASNHDTNEKLIQEKLLNEIKSFINNKENQEFLKRFFEAAVGYTQSPMIAADLIAECNKRDIIQFLIEVADRAVSNLSKKQMVAESLDKWYALIERCILLDNAPKEKHLHTVFNTLESLQIKLLSIFIKAGVDFNKYPALPEHSVMPYPGYDALKAIGNRHALLEFVLTHANPPITDKACVQATIDCTDNSSSKAVTTLQMLQKYRIQQHAKMVNKANQFIESHLKMTKDGKENTKSSVVDTSKAAKENLPSSSSSASAATAAAATSQNTKNALEPSKAAKDDKENTEFGTLDSWIKIARMELREPMWRFKSENMEVVAKVTHDFIQQYGFHPDLDDDAYEKLLKATNKPETAGNDPESSEAQGFETFETQASEEVHAPIILAYQYQRENGHDVFSTTTDAENNNGKLSSGKPM